MSELTATALDHIRQCAESHNASHVFALFSGGHDSLCATHIAMQTGLVTGVAHINTGVGVHATRQFVRDTCQRYGWPLLELFAKEDCGQDYAAFVMRDGFPGPHGHGMMYARLKDRCIRKLLRDHKDGNRPVALISGCRREESTRRMGTVEPVQRQGRRLWIAPCCNWSGSDQAAYMRQHGLPRNPVKDMMCMSGECLCGAFAQKGELAEWMRCFPDDEGVRDLVALRDKVVADHPWDWDEGPPKWYMEKKRGQDFMFQIQPKIEMLCTRCNSRHESVVAAAKGVAGE